MSVIHDFEETLANVKNKVEGDFKDVIKHLESVFHHLHVSHADEAVKTAIVTDLHAATVKIDNIANAVRTDADAADKAVETAANTTTTKS